MRRYKLLIFILLIFGVSALTVFASDFDTKLNDLSKQIITTMTQNKKATIAVIEFSDIDGKITALGKSIAEELTTKLFKTNKFQVIERELLNKVLNEHKFNLSGLVDPGSAKELGKILGVNAIVSGTITELEKTVRLNARLIDTETGSIFGVAAVELKKNGDINKLLGQVMSSPKTEEATVDSKVAQSEKTTDTKVTPLPKTEENIVDSIVTQSEKTTDTNEKQILYQTGFDDGQATRWSTWGLGMEVEEVDNNYVYSVSGSSFNSCTGAHYQGGSNWTDYRFQVRVKPIYDKDHPQDVFQFQFRYSNLGVYIITYENGMFNLYKYINGNGTNLTKGFFDCSQSKWYTVAVTLLKNNIQLFVDNKKVINYTDTGDPRLLNGSISVEAFYKSHIHFDDIIVEAL